MKRILFAVLALVLGAAGSIRAQNPTQARPTPPFPAANGEVLGAVVDTATKEPVARASVAIRSRKDSSLITGAIAGPDGSFHIQGLRPGDYYLRTTAIGFKPRSYTFSITDAAPRANVGSLTLTRPALKRAIGSTSLHRTGVDAMQGRIGVVTRAIGELESGLVKVGGETWTARSFYDEEPIAEGSRVEVIKIEGVTALVVPAPSPRDDPTPELEE
jgi:hypothetical protein